MLAGPGICLVAALEIPYSTVFSKGKVHVARWRTQTRSIEKIFLDRADHLWSIVHTHEPTLPRPTGNRMLLLLSMSQGLSLLKTLDGKVIRNTPSKSPPLMGMGIMLERR